MKLDQDQNTRHILMEKMTEVSTNTLNNYAYLLTEITIFDININMLLVFVRAKSSER